MLRRQDLTIRILVLAAFGATLGALGVADASLASLGASLRHGLPVLLCAALVGRVALSLLPPGPIGRHGRADLPITWAASHLVGLVVLGLESAVSALAGLELGPLALLAPWLVVLAGRLLTLPGAMVPRHEPAAERPVGWRRALPGAAAALVVLVALAGAAHPAPPASPGGETPLGALVALLAPDGPAAAGRLVAGASFGAALVALAHGLRVARRAPGERAAVVVLVAGVPFVREATLLAPALLTASALLVGGAVFGVAWLRRADRRAQWLALLAFVGLPLATWNGLALCGFGLVALVWTTPRASRAALLVRALAAWLLLAWPVANRYAEGLASDTMDWIEVPPATTLAALADLRDVGFAALAALAGVLGALPVLWLRLRSPAPRPPGSVDPPLRDLLFAAALALLAFFALRLGWVDLPGSQAVRVATWARLALCLWLPLGALAGGLAWLRAETPGGD